MSDPSEASCCKASALTAAWAKEALARTRGADASFTSLAWYKGINCFNAVGDPASANELLARFERIVSPRGDFHPDRDMSLGRALTTYGASQTWSNVLSVAFHAPLGLWRNYRNAWIACGAHRLGATQLSERTLDFLAATLHSSLGAAPHNDLLSSERRIYDIGTNASIAHAMLVAGRADIAIRLAEFLKRVILSQPIDARRVFQALDSGGQPLVSPGNKLIQKQFWIEIGAPAQSYWILGFALKVFGMLFKLTGNRDWLDPAGRVLAWFGRCHADFARNITCAKLSWGTAEMFAATGDRAWRELAVTSIAAVADLQNTHGVWIRPDYPWWFPQPLLITLDTSVERMYYLREVPQSLREGGMPLAA